MAALAPLAPFLLERVIQPLGELPERSRSFPKLVIFFFKALHGFHACRERIGVFVVSHGPPLRSYTGHSKMEAYRQRRAFGCGGTKVLLRTPGPSAPGTFGRRGPVQHLINGGEQEREEEKEAGDGLDAQSGAGDAHKPRHDREADG